MSIKRLIQNRLCGEPPDIFNLSKANEEATMLTRIIGQDCKPGNDPCYVKSLAHVEVGDTLAITNAGAYVHERGPSSHFHKPISEHYLNARRICQVPI